MLTPQDIIQFGKFKGKKFEIVLKEGDYCRWLLTQSWFKGEARELLEKFYLPSSKKCLIKD